MGRHRILVTGLSGFVGSVLAGVAKAHPQAASIDLLPFAGPDGAPIDVRDATAVGAAVTRERPTAVIHLAAIALPRQAAENPGEAWAVNVLGTFNLAHAVLTQAPAALFVFAGSSEAYGESFRRQPRPLAEDAPLDPLSPYGATKAAADIMLGQMARQGLRTIRFRPFNHTGAGQASHYVVSSFARQIARIERGLQPPAMRVGNLAVRRDLLDARDVARAYLDAALGASDAALGDAFNLSTGSAVAIETVLSTLLRMTASSIEVTADPALLRPNEIATISGDPSKASDMLGWRPQIALTETLAAVLDHWRRSPEV